MMLSPAAIKKYGRDLATHPVCAGPFRLAERVAQDHITLTRFRRYWNPAAIHLDRIVYRPIPDTTVRLVNLQTGQLDLIERMAATDAAKVSADKRLRLVTSPALAYGSLLFDLTRGKAAGTPLAKDRLVREAFAKSLDRAAINQVAFSGQYIPSNQTETPGSRYWNPAHPVPKRDLAGAKALLRQAGVSREPVAITLANDPIDRQVGELIQAMAGEAGFDVTLQSEEANAQVAAGRAGDFQATLVIWSGRADPDQNVSIWLQCNGFLNWGGYCNKSMDALLAQGRATLDATRRVPIYHEVADVYLKDRPMIVLFHYRWLWGMTRALHGFVPAPDGMIRPQGITLGGG